jgi:hypothetical protein
MDSLFHLFLFRLSPELPRRTNRNDVSQRVFFLGEERTLWEPTRPQAKKRRSMRFVTQDFWPNGGDQRLATLGLSTPPGFIASPLHRLVHRRVQGPVRPT